jgi:ketosteroid isomerase-like protein
MKNIKRCGLAVVVLIPVLLLAQQRSSAPAPTAQSVVEEWFRRWNALDGSEASIQRFVDLYHPNAIHQAAPSGKQIGPVFLEAPAGIRKLAEDFSRANTDVAFRLETATANEKSQQLFYAAQGPWDGPAVGVQFVGAYTVRATKKRFFYPGAAFFHIKDGKILYARFYSARDELAEVQP